ncbi:hypothetical protein GGX14DRAFT_607855 [Mycena pura]|uniref:Uncharacterized protein n=1 Tax=Mycena pura TaxID=153505 RepID=A0AAD6XZD4_9AGAR|nr:hypothetical protein GGX14DRAFT_607855 [Mycena pura]
MHASDVRAREMSSSARSTNKRPNIKSVNPGPTATAERCDLAACSQGVLPAATREDIFGPSNNLGVGGDARVSSKSGSGNWSASPDLRADTHVEQLLRTLNLNSPEPSPTAGSSPKSTGSAGSGSGASGRSLSRTKPAPPPLDLSFDSTSASNSSMSTANGSASIDLDLS